MGNLFLVPNEGGEIRLDMADMADGTSESIWRARGLGHVTQPSQVSVDAKDLTGTHDDCLWTLALAVFANQEIPPPTHAVVNTRSIGSRFC